MFKKAGLLLAAVSILAFAQSKAFAQEEFASNFYVNSIKDKVELNWLRPEGIEGKSAVIAFTVNPDGSITNVSVLRGSGNDSFDKSAVKAVYKAQPIDLAAKYNKPINIEFFFSPIFTVANKVSDKSEPNVVDIASTNPYIDFSQYTATLEEKINSAWKPKCTIGNRKAIASLNIGNDGSLGDFHIVKTSRSKRFDRDVLDAIANSVPYDSFPENVKASNTDVQLVFEKKCKKEFNEQSVSASVVNVVGYDKYIKQVESILADTFSKKRYYLHKDLTVEIKINKVGQLNYVRILTPSKDKIFDRKTIAAIQKIGFPSIPETIPFEDVTLRYEIVTQRGYSLRDFAVDYVLQLGSTGLKPFGLKEEINPSGIQNASLVKTNKNEETGIANAAYFKPYMKDIEKKIKSNWHPKRYTKSTKVVTLFKIDKNGEIKDLKVLKSSKNETFDIDAMNAISVSSPLEALPKEFEGDSVDVQFTFDYNVFGARSWISK